ncbi:hypothetical protein L195_g040435, partial [Trifolium pratense]
MQMLFYHKLVRAMDQTMDQDPADNATGAVSQGVTSEVVKEGDSQATTEESVPPPAAAVNRTSAWDGSFDPLVFVERNILMDGDST